MAEPAAAATAGLVPGLITALENLEIEWRTRWGLEQGVYLDRAV